MAITTDPAAVAAPEGLTPKARRAQAFLAAHAERMERLAGLRWECSACGSLIGKYQPPIRRVEEPCRKCGVYNVLTTEPASPAL